MNVELDFIFRTLKGEPIKTGAEKSEDLTMRDVCVNCLTVIDDRTTKVEPAEKYRRGALAQKIFEADGTIDLSLEDAVLLKELIGILGSPLVVKQAWDLLDPSLKN